MQWQLRDVLLLVACAALGGAVAETAMILGVRLTMDRIFPFNPQGFGSRRSQMRCLCFPQSCSFGHCEVAPLKLGIPGLRHALALSRPARAASAHSSTGARARAGHSRGWRGR